MASFIILYILFILYIPFYTFYLNKTDFLVSRFFPDQFYKFCCCGEVRTFSISFAAKSTRGSTEWPAAIVVQTVILITAGSRGQIHLFTIVQVFVHLQRGVGRCFFIAFFNQSPYTCGNGIVDLFGNILLFVV